MTVVVNVVILEWVQMHENLQVTQMKIDCNTQKTMEQALKIHKMTW